MTNETKDKLYLRLFEQIWKIKGPNVIILYFAGDATQKVLETEEFAAAPPFQEVIMWKGDGVNGVVAAKWDLVLMWSWKMTTS